LLIPGGERRLRGIIEVGRRVIRGGWRRRLERKNLGRGECCRVRSCGGGLSLLRGAGRCVGGTASRSFGVLDMRLEMEGGLT